MPYLKWLQVLIALGPKLPAILTALQTLLDAIGQAFPVKDDGGTLNIVSPSTEEMEAETQVASLLAGPNAAFDGSRLRDIFKRLEASGLLDVLTALLLKKLAGG